MAVPALGYLAPLPGGGGSSAPRRGGPSRGRAGPAAALRGAEAATAFPLLPPPGRPGRHQRPRGDGKRRAPRDLTASKSPWVWREPLAANRPVRYKQHQVRIQEVVRANWPWARVFTQPCFCVKSNSRTFLSVPQVAASSISTNLLNYNWDWNYQLLEGSTQTSHYWHLFSVPYDFVKY